MFDRKLDGVSHVLILAAAAFTEVLAERLHAIGRGPQHPNQTRAGKALFQFGDFRLDLLSHKHKRNEDDEIVQPSNSLAPERDIDNRNGDAGTKLDLRAGRKLVLNVNKLACRRSRVRYSQFNTAEFISYAGRHRSDVAASRRRSHSPGPARRHERD